MKITSWAISWLRALVLIWASMWMLAVPFFHVHPEADHLHGEAGHLHGGTVHTVWSPDLDCEFDGHRDVDRTGRITDADFSCGAQFAHVGDRHAEFGLSLLNDTTDRTSIKPSWASALGYVPVDDLVAQQYVRIRRSFGAVLPPMPFMRAISSRAPPSLLI
ncbi:MAG: hypothetical protein AB7L09_17850 [Nitrospira sp.]